MQAECLLGNVHSKESLQVMATLSPTFLLTQECLSYLMTWSRRDLAQAVDQEQTLEVLEDPEESFLLFLPAKQNVYQLLGEDSLDGIDIFEDHPAVVPSDHRVFTWSALVAQLTRGNACILRDSKPADE